MVFENRVLERIVGYMKEASITKLQIPSHLLGCTICFKNKKKKEQDFVVMRDKS
jgi:hypothetical protein